MLLIFVAIRLIGYQMCVYNMCAVRNLLRPQPPQAESGGDNKQKNQRQRRRRCQTTAGLAPQIPPLLAGIVASEKKD